MAGGRRDGGTYHVARYTATYDSAALRDAIRMMYPAPPRQSSPLSSKCRVSGPTTTTTTMVVAAARTTPPPRVVLTY